jgi:DNA-binding NarL/FixJ family response regulator
MSSSRAGAPRTSAHETPVLRPLDGTALDPLVQPQCSLAVHVRRVTGSVVGRAGELSTVERALKEATGRLAAVTLEGEPGIGKTRLLLTASEMATADGFVPVAVTADEEIRGPFLLAQSIFAAPALREAVREAPTDVALTRATDALAGRDEEGFEALSADAKLLRTFDLAAIALGVLAAERPLALLVDDVQWADDDTLRLLRYVVRADVDRPIFLLLAVRPDEFAQVTEAVNFVADMERMGVVQRLRLGRFSPPETTGLLRQMLAGSVDPASAEAMHAQSEGVPFIVEELVRTYREVGLLQQLDGTWRLARNAERLVPSAVRTLIGRRATHLPPETQAVLSDAAVLGRSFSLRDLRAIRERVADAATDHGGADLADLLTPAVSAGLLLQHPEAMPADYTFTHEQVREFAASALPQSRSRQLHRALVDLLLESGDPSPAGLPLLARHAFAAGDTERAARFSIDAARAALASNAPEEALRLIERALPMVDSADDRRTLLITRDDAFAVLRRPVDRLDRLAELAALAEASKDADLELDVQLRRAAAMRMTHDEETAAELARRARERAAATGNRHAELRANLELGQALLRSPIGEGFSPTGSEVDLGGAEEAYRRAVALAEELSDDRSLAAALREIGAINVGRIRDWFVEQVRSGAATELAARVAAGEDLGALLMEQPIAPLFHEATQLYERALALYEQLGDRTGVMSTVIAMAYIAYAPVIHITSSARHLEEIRRVTGRLTSLVTESERARQELQMLYGIHVYARAKVVPDLMLSRGEEAYRSARILGDRSIEFLAAGGVALAHLEMGELDEAAAWLDRASSCAASTPSAVRARQLEAWRGALRGAAGDAEGMRQHLERAVQLAVEQGRPAARAEALAHLALEAAQLGAAAEDGELLELAERSANDAKNLHALLPGHARWGAQADAALATVALARGDGSGAAAAAGAVMHFLQEALQEDACLEELLPASRALLAGAAPESEPMVRSHLRLLLSRIVQGTANEEMRVRWLRGPRARELVELAGPMSVTEGAGTAGAEAGLAANLDDVDRQLLSLLTQGGTNREMAEALGIDEEAVAQRLARLLVSLGASSRAEATSLAIRGMSL